MGILGGITGAAQAAGLFGAGGLPGSNTAGFATAANIAGDIATGATVANFAIEGITALSTTVGAVAPFLWMAGPIAAAAAAVLEVISICFKGADPNQVPAAQIEQVFEASALDMQYLATAGYLTKAEATAGMEKLIQAGDAYYAQAVTNNPQYARDQRPFKNGQANMTKSIREFEGTVANLPEVTLLPWDQNSASSLYIQEGARGWYSQPGQSIEAATNLTNGFMAALRATMPANQAPAGGPAPSPAVSAIGAAPGAPGPQNSSPPVALVSSAASVAAIAPAPSGPLGGHPMLVLLAIAVALVLAWLLARKGGDV